MADRTDRTKFGYYDYSDIRTKIDDGVLNEWDIVLGKDTHEQYLILGDKSIQPIKSKIYTYNSVNQANTALNQQSDTYRGQMVGIVGGGTVKGYIVDYENDSFFITPLGENNYMNLENKPTINGIELTTTTVIGANDVGAVNTNNKITNSEIDLIISAIFG